MDMEFLRGALYETRKPAAKASGTFDSCGSDNKNADDDKKPAFDSAAEYAQHDIALRAAAAVQQWVETDDLDEGETYADRLLALVVGIADENKDGDVTEEEAEVCDAALNAVASYLASKGASEEDISALLNDWDEGAAGRIRDLVASALPDGEEAADADIDNFAFTDEDQEPAFDAVYRKTFAIRHGKKVKINKRISGTVRLSAKQKMAIRKAQRKSHSAAAVMRRLKSMKLRKRSGL